MAVRPKRKDPISTRPIYLPRVPARELQEALRAGGSTGAPCLRIYLDASPSGLDVEDLAQRLGGSGGLPAAFAGEVLSTLVGRPQTEVRDTVAAAAHRLAWARIRDPARHEYRVLPLRGEVDREEARFRARSQPEYGGLRGPSPTAGALYDGAEVQAAYRELLPQGPEDGSVTYIVVTDRRLGRWDADVKRWTPLTVFPGVPLVVSVGSEGKSLGADAILWEIRQALYG